MQVCIEYFWLGITCSSTPGSVSGNLCSPWNVHSQLCSWSHIQSVLAIRLIKSLYIIFVYLYIYIPYLFSNPYTRLPIPCKVSNITFLMRKFSEFLYFLIFRIWIAYFSKLILCSEFLLHSCWYCARFCWTVQFSYKPSTEYSMIMPVIISHKSSKIYKHYYLLLHGWVLFVTAVQTRTCTLLYLAHSCPDKDKCSCS